MRQFTCLLLTQTGVQRSSQWLIDMKGLWAIAVSFGSRKAISIRRRPPNLHKISPAEFSSSDQRHHRIIGSKAWSKIGLLGYGRQIG